MTKEKLFAYAMRERIKANEDAAEKCSDPRDKTWSRGVAAGLISALEYFEAYFGEQKTDEKKPRQHHVTEAPPDSLNESENRNESNNINTETFRVITGVTIKEIDFADPDVSTDVVHKVHLSNGEIAEVWSGKTCEIVPDKHRGPLEPGAKLFAISIEKFNYEIPYQVFHFERQ